MPVPDAETPPQHAARELAALREEVDQLRDCIQAAKREMAGIKPADPSADRFLAATGELSAVVQAAETATAEILDGAERVSAALADLVPGGPISGAALAALQDASMDIMMACSFQDLTGQRVNKVVNTLRYIEDRLAAMGRQWGNATPAESVQPAGGTVLLPHRHDDTRPDAHLLHGPAAEPPSQAVIDDLFSADAAASQDDIDAMFG